MVNRGCSEEDYFWIRICTEYRAFGNISSPENTPTTEIKLCMYVCMYTVYKVHTNIYTSIHIKHLTHAYIYINQSCPRFMHPLPFIYGFHRCRHLQPNPSIQFVTLPPRRLFQILFTC